MIECVPNFSEGRDPAVIRQITDAVKSVEGVKLLHVDPGYAANRTVVTFVGEPEAVTEAAFRAAATAAQVIDMRQHHGTHPRIGATDVLPLIPLSGMTLDECAILARQLAQRMATEANIPCYCYEAAALRPQFRNLAVCRQGEYEALDRKLSTPELQPDFLPPVMAGKTEIPECVRRSGCSVVGAREFLVAVNFNLNTKDVAIAKAIAADVRQKGPEGRPYALPTVKAIGWYIDEYGIAQVSTNLTDINTTPLHVAFDVISRCAQEHGVSVTGTEIVGLIPQRVLTEAGDEAIRRMHLDELAPFVPEQRVLELLAAK
ncbi:MAG: glutamate formimidoyltransferase [Prevotella sp.]|nr:glutamate formimidoyltransferase [Prevotella sp.]